MTKTISLCMIVKNEAANLAKCLDSVRGIPDEIIIVDTGSTDKTVEIARRYTDKIYRFEWIDDFSAARNFAFSKGKMDYLMWLDADDIITPENREKFIAFKSKLPNVDIVYMPYHTRHDENGKPITIVHRERLMKKTRKFKWEGAIHEGIDLAKVTGKQIHSDIFITHTKHVGIGSSDEAQAASKSRNFQVLERLIKSGNYTKKDLYYYATTMPLTDDPMKDTLPYLLELIENPGNMYYFSYSAHLLAYVIYLKAGMNDKAFKILADYEERNGHLAEYYSILGSYYREVEKNTEKAIENYKKALTCTGIPPIGLKGDTNFDFYYFQPNIRLGELYVETQRFDEALIHFQKALTYKPDDKGARSSAAQLAKIIQMGGL